MSVMQVLTIASIGMTVGGQIFGGMSDNRAARDEARALEREAALARQEELAEADRLEKEHTRFLAKQSLMFLKGGVTLSGSPLFVLEETREEKDKQIEAQINRANARYGLGRTRANIVRSSGRASLIGGLFGGIGSGTTMFAQAKAAKIF